MIVLNPLFCILVRGQGLEPRLKASKASVLPLDDPRSKAVGPGKNQRIGMRLSSRSDAESAKLIMDIVASTG